jgi:hypothetical protein
LPLSAAQGISNDATAARIVLIVLLIITIDLCILVPIAIYVAMPQRATKILERLRAWLIAHQRQVMAWLLTIFGVALTAAAIIHLV